MNMKKITTLLAAAALTCAMGTTAFAADQDGVSTGDYTADVNGTYQAGGAVVYSVDIAWTDMNFTYTGAGEGTWDPETHQYSGSSEGAWTASNDSITVTNHSNAAVKATASYQAETGYESTTMTFGNNEATVATAVGTEVASAEPLPKAPMAARSVPSP